MVNLGNIYNEGRYIKRDPEMAIAYWDDADCRYHLALYYYHGQGGIKKNYRVAIELFTSIESKTESKECCYMLGECYRLGCGVKKDNQQAANWYIKAGNVIAYKKLLKMQRQGKIDIESMKN